MPAVKTEETRMVKAAALVEDFNLYPRTKVDATHVRNLVRSMKAGCEMPPVLIDKKTKIIVDGIHRTRAALQLGGDLAEIQATIRSYKNRAAMLLDAIDINAAHGHRLHERDLRRSLKLCDDLGIEREVARVHLHVTDEDVEKLAISVIINDETDEVVPNKRGGEWLAGQRLTSAQIEDGLEPVRSLEVGRLCRELSRLLRHDLVNWSDDRIKNELVNLSLELAASLKKHAE